MPEADAENTISNSPEPSRNVPCPCGSGKKYKRCHGVNAPPKLSTPAAVPGTFAQAAGMPGMPGGMPFDPSQLDPQWMAQFTTALQRLPRGQLQKLQGMMQRATSGGDVSREAAEFEKMLPPDLQALMRNFQMPGMPGGMGMGEAAQPSIDAESSSAMDLEEAKRIVAAAAAEGKLSEEQATQLIENAPESGSEEAGSKIGKLFRSWKK